MARQSQQQRAEARRQSLMQQYNLGAGLDPKTKELADRLYKPAPTGYRGSRKLGGEQDQQKAYQRNVDFINKYSIPDTMFAEAAATGVDPRTIESLRKQSDKARDEAIKIRSMSGAPGMAGAVYSSRLRNIGNTVGLLAADLRGQLKSDVQKQPEFQEIRRRREKAVKQAAIGMTRKRGKASLLSSQGGGAGFFQRYFK
jgi:hypothetical protein